ncbi:MAG TPA: hypothetical protein VMH61_01205 [Candidatus Acidoferrales bacterium]|nr:hypothetical protein [Candidatus Acidoferrales bacterium]
MNGREHDDTLPLRLAQLLGATKARADHAVLMRARARIAASAEMPEGVRWLGTPIALATAATIFVAALSFSAVMLNGETAAAADNSSLVSALIGDDGTYGLPSANAERPVDGAGDDTGEVARQ